MNVPHEDKKLHNDGFFKSYMGYKEWFHYTGTFSVDGKLLAFVIGFPLHLRGMGALGWISYGDHNSRDQYSLAGNPQYNNCRGFFKLENRADFAHFAKKYEITYPEMVGGSYSGHITGGYPDYTINLYTPELELEIKMKINSPDTSVVKRNLSPWINGGWFHSGDVAVSLKGTLAGKPVEAETKGKGWYERNWAHIPTPSAEWFWFMTHLDNGDVFNMLAEKCLNIQINYLNECWLYQKPQTFCDFSHYKAHIPPELKEAIKKQDYSDIIGKRICGKGKNKKNSFKVKATIVDFRQYEYQDCCASIKWANFILETEGEVTINSNPVSMNGQGVAEWAQIAYWWC